MPNPLTPEQKAAYAAKRKAKYDAENPVRRPRGRPRKVPEPPAAPTSELGGLAAAHHGAEPDSDTIVAIPEEFHNVLGSTISIPGQLEKLPCMNARLWTEYSPTTRRQYPSMLRTACRASGLEPPETSDHIALGEFLSDLPDQSFWKYVRMCLSSDTGADSRNNGAKAFGTILNCILKPALLAGKTGPLIDTMKFRSQVMNVIVRNAVRESLERHASQTQSDNAAANTVPWLTWYAAAIKYINRNPISRDSIIVAVYTLIPPIRNNWATVEITDTAPARDPDDHRNYIVVEPSGRVVTYWGDFKNRSSFRDELPLKIVPNSIWLQEMLRTYIATCSTKWLFPAPESDHFTTAGFGGHIAKLAQKIVGVNFTVQRMRVSFITYYYESHPKINVKETIALMRELHQTNLSVHLGYSKRKLAEELARQVKSVADEWGSE